MIISTTDSFRKVKSAGGDVFVRPSLVCAITDFTDQHGRPMPGRCMIHLVGGGVLALPLDKESAFKAVTGQLDLAGVTDERSPA